MVGPPVLSDELRARATSWLNPPCPPACQHTMDFQLSLPTRLSTHQVHDWMRRYEQEGATCVLVALAVSSAPLRLAAALAIADPLKPEAPAVVAALR